MQYQIILHMTENKNKKKAYDIGSGSNGSTTPAPPMTVAKVITTNRRNK